MRASSNSALLLHVRCFVHSRTTNHGGRVGSATHVTTIMCVFCLRWHRARVRLCAGDIRRSAMHSALARAVRNERPSVAQVLQRPASPWMCVALLLRQCIQTLMIQKMCDGATPHHHRCPRRQLLDAENVHQVISVWLSSEMHVPCFFEKH